MGGRAPAPGPPAGGLGRRLRVRGDEPGRGPRRHGRNGWRLLRGRRGVSPYRAPISITPVLWIVVFLVVDLSRYLFPGGPSGSMCCGRATPCTHSSVELDYTVGLPSVRSNP